MEHSEVIASLYAVETVKIMRLVTVYLKCRKLKSNTYLRRRFRDFRGKICFKLVNNQFHS